MRGLARARTATEALQRIVRSTLSRTPSAPAYSPIPAAKKAASSFFPHCSRYDDKNRKGPSYIPGATALTAAAAASLSVSTTAESPPGPSPSPSATSAKDAEAVELVEGVHYQVYDHKGNPVSLDDLLEAAQKVQVVLLGEYHDDPVAHFLQHQLLHRSVLRWQDASAPSASTPADQPAPAAPASTSAAGNESDGGPAAAPGAAAAARRPALSLEMFERDVQPVMDEYLQGVVRERDLLRDARPWPNYPQDYRPLVECAKAAECHVICANAPRRYVSLAGREGREALGRLRAAVQPFLAPLPYRPPSPEYIRKVNASMALAHGASEPPPQGPGAGAGGGGEGQGGEAAAGGGECPYIGFKVSSNFLDAQTLWDATMAYSIACHLERHPEDLVLHVCGKFHSEGRLGIPEHLAGAYAPAAALFSVNFVPCEDVVVSGPEQPLHTILSEPIKVVDGDFVVLTSSRLPRSFQVQHPV